jgi:hypothetical protein
LFEDGTITPKGEAMNYQEEAAHFTGENDPDGAEELGQSIANAVFEEWLLEASERIHQHDAKINLSKCTIECRECGEQLVDLNPLIDSVLRVPRKEQV